MPFFFKAPATTDISTLSLHDALPISALRREFTIGDQLAGPERIWMGGRSEEHTSELQSPMYLVCRLLLEKKKYNILSTQRPPTIRSIKPILPILPRRHA